MNILERHPIFLSSGNLEKTSSGLSGLVFTISSTVRQHNNKNSRFLRLPTAGCSLNNKIIATPCISKQPPLGEHRGREQVQACLCWPSPSAPLPPAPWTREAARRRTGGGEGGGALVAPQRWQHQPQTLYAVGLCQSVRTNRP